MILKNSVFIHIPKTGGTYVREFLKKADLVEKTCNDWHEYPPQLKHHEKPIFCFVRNPVDWLHSFWSFMMSRQDRDPKHLIWYGPTKFLEFVELYLTNDSGYVSKEFRLRTNGATYIGKQERLVEHLIRILQICGEKFTPPHVKRRRVRGSAKAWTIPNDLRERIYEAELDACKRFGYGAYSADIRSGE